MSWTCGAAGSARDLRPVEELAVAAVVVAVAVAEPLLVGSG